MRLMNRAKLRTPLRSFASLPLLVFVGVRYGGDAGSWRHVGDGVCAMGWRLSTVGYFPATTARGLVPLPQELTTYLRRIKKLGPTTATRGPGADTIIAEEEDSPTAEMAHSRRTTPPPLPVTRPQAAETASATTSRDWLEKNLEIGAVTVVFATGILLGLVCLPAEAKHPGNVRLTAARLLSMATFLSGIALTLLSFSMLGLRDHLVSSGQRAAAKCLRAACPATWVLTLLSLLAFIPRKVYLYIALGFVTVIAAAAAGAHWCLRRRRADGGEAADGRGEEDNKELDAASKITSWVTNSAFGGIVGVIFSVSKIASATEAGAVDAAIFFMLATAIIGMFVMTVSKKVAEIGDPRRRRFFVGAVRLANSFLLCTLACAGLAASFAVLRFRVFAAFAPLAVTSTVSFLLRHCVARRRRGGGEEDDHDARVKAMEDVASKVMAMSVAFIMSVLGGWLAEKDHARWGKLDTSMVALTSALMSSFGFMVLAAAPGSAVRERLAPVAKVLIWSTALLFVAAALTVYGMEVSGVKP